MSTILFLDFDDVLCLNVVGGYGGYDVMLAMAEVEKGTKGLADFEKLWTTLFDAQAKAHLRALHDEFCPTYVLSTSWTRFLDRDALATVTRQAGLGFVADHLHTEWETIKGHNTLRRDEILAWLAMHPECADSWVIVDDAESGTGLQAISEEDGAYVVLCEVGVGLTADNYGELRRALFHRANSEQQGLPKRVIQDIAVSLDESAVGHVVPYEFGPSREAGRG